MLTFLGRRGTALRGRGRPRRRVSGADLLAGARILWRLGVLEAGRLSFWVFLARMGVQRPARLAKAMGFAATGYHLRRVTQRFLNGSPPPTRS